MLTVRCILIFSVLTSFSGVKAQAFDRTYQGSWAATNWLFDFNSSGEYIRTSTGHYGNTVVTGNYKINKDTILLLSGFKGTDGTVNEKYFIDNDSLIIDLELCYDYKLIKSELNFYNSKKRYDILEKPNLDSMIVVNKQQFDSIVGQCTSLLNTRRNIELKDEDNIEIIRAINTLQMDKGASLKNGIYAEFLKLVQEKNYKNEISSFYDWIPNRGMGFYFQKLQIELGGTPHLCSRYIIK